jgi:SAM-dependent methyltransferase
VTSRAGWGFSTDEVRLLFSRHLCGHGVELGPGHHPYAIMLPGTEVRYLDRWEPAENRQLFPELGEEAEFPEPDIVCNLDEEKLGVLADASQDFVIASHVFEHVANPLALLVDCHRVLKPGGTLLVLLPDRTMTSDRVRPPTSLPHLVEEYEQGVTKVADEHLEEYVRLVEGYTGHDPQELARRFEHHRRRSVHVHCWREPEFFEVLEYAASELGAAFELLELLRLQDVTPNKEFGYVLRRPLADLPPDVARRRLAESRQLLAGTGGTTQPRLRAELEAARRRIARLDRVLEGRGQRIARLQAKVDRYDARLDRLRHTPLYPAWRALRRVRARRRHG